MATTSRFFDRGTGKVDYLDNPDLPMVRFQWVYKGVAYVIHFCNFRRYAWDWTDDPTGERSYGQGPCYANADDGGLPCEDGTQVIRDTFIKALAQLPVPEELKYSIYVRPVLERLYQDAITHAWHHSMTPVGRTNGPCVDVTVDGEGWTYAKYSALEQLEEQEDAELRLQRIDPEIAKG